MIDGQPYPISFFSQKLSKTQQTWSTFERELLDYLAVGHFRHLIDGRTITLFTSHKPLVSAFTSVNTPKSDKQQRYLSFISEYVHKVLKTLLLCQETSIL